MMIRNTILTLALLAAPSFATTAEFSILGLEHSLTKQVKLKIDGANQWVWAGPSIATLDGGDPFLVFCADLFTYFESYTWDANILMPDDFSVFGGRVAWVYENYIDIIDTQTKGAGVQVAIWDILHDGGDGFYAGRVQGNRLDSAVRSYANSILAASLGMTSDAARFFEDARGRSYNQPQVGPAPPPSEVPESNSFILGGAGLMLVFLVQRQRRAAASQA